ncbi:MAG TPA: hypothetical protein VFW98_06215 [Gemmatimonadaceae bacterium]|nr:hypothetical protein [Gemmatimonadaceae bacterium]
MKRLAIVAAAALLLAACKAKEANTVPADTSPAMAPAPAASDTGMAMPTDSGTMKKDTTKS